MGKEKRHGELSSPTMTIFFGTVMALLMVVVMTMLFLMILFSHCSGKPAEFLLQGERFPHVLAPTNEELQIFPRNILPSFQ